MSWENYTYNTLNNSCIVYQVCTELQLINIECSDQHFADNEFPLHKVTCNEYAWGEAVNANLAKDKFYVKYIFYFWNAVLVLSCQMAQAIHK